MKVLITGINGLLGQKLVHKLSRDNSILRSQNLSGVTSIDFDLTDYENYAELDEYIKSFKKIDVLINNAGFLVNKDFEKTTIEDFKKIYSVNVFSVAMLIKYTIQYMSINSSIVNISSIGGIQGSVKFSGLSAYSSSKGALNILTEMLAEEYKDKNIHFNTLALGSVQTKMLEKAFPGFNALTSAKKMANYIFEFSTDGYKLFNGKIIPVSSSTP